MNIEHFFDPATFTLTYVVFDRDTRDAVVIDPVLDYDPLSSQASTRSVAAVEAFLRAKALKLHYVLETHAPRLLFPSVQVNVDAGRLPRPHANGKRYLTIPLDMKEKTDDDGTPGVPS